MNKTSARLEEREEIMTKESQCAPHIHSVNGGRGRGRKGLRCSTEVTTPTE